MDDLRDQLAGALRAAYNAHGTSQRLPDMVSYGTLANAVLSVVGLELERLRAELLRLRAELDKQRERAEGFVDLSAKYYAERNEALNELDELRQRAERAEIMYGFMKASAGVSDRNAAVLRQRAERAEADADRLDQLLIDEREITREQQLRAQKAEAAIERVRARHTAVRHGGLTICAECSAWTGTRCRGEVRPHPCPTLAALDTPTPTETPRRLTEQQGGIPNDAITRDDWESAYGRRTPTEGETP